MKPVAPVAGRVVVGGELIFESIDTFLEGKFALRSQGAVVHFTAARRLHDSHKMFAFGDKVEVSATQVSVSCDPHVAIAGDLNLKLLVRPLREGKSLQFEFDHAQKWHRFIRAIRDFFDSRGFLETLTPSLVTNPGMEPELEPLQTEFRHSKIRQKLFLPTSPELHLKQILTAGFTEIFEIKSCFRNEEVTIHHQPEFQMLEWYRAYATISSIEEDLIELVSEVADCPGIAVKRSSIAQLFLKYFDFQLTPTTSRQELESLSNSNEIETAKDDSWNDIFHRLFVTKIEAGLGAEGPQIVFDFPPSQAALARLTPDGWADRFELYWNGLEIANAFHELNDPKEQLSRFKADQKRREERGKMPLEIDQNFMRALEAGLPPSAGIALGLDRLFMAIHGFSEIRQARFFTVDHQLT